jgi:hypothetical protein
LAIAAPATVEGERSPIQTIFISQQNMYRHDLDLVLIDQFWAEVTAAIRKKVDENPRYSAEMN